MDNREEVREFLTSRRAKITPQQAGLPAGPRRRVPGLRRSEVAALADMSVEYYAKLERGNLAGVSPSVLEALARALQLDDAERAHLLNLAQAADGSDVLNRPRRRRTKDQWRPHRSLEWTLDAITAGPAFVRNGRMDILAANPLARAFYADVYAAPGNQANLARFNFLDPASRRFYPDWDLFADVAVAILRTEAGRNPHDKDLHDLVGELSTRREEFRTRWGAHNVRHHGTGTKRFHHSAVGELTLAYEGLEMAAEPGLTLTIYTAEPGSPSEEGLRLLASWAATQNSDIPSTTENAGR
ncbi:helix-turn-helix protein [Streptomyces sp. 840.1]|uniref:helix-turn-helix transcriptional regulator n=1 Tax=Streptomyces sp. 840.1 TaxID=2485152 RepID=UPI000F4604C2|nr:helix-turn-helix transcriptional regulator [Streptomyces sp. 840.1]ROQ63753.1 helix-turn-helix protein [Streptomyces sp. 840.1]